MWVANTTQEFAFLLESLGDLDGSRVIELEEDGVEEFGSTGELVTLGLADCSIGANTQRVGFEELDILEGKVSPCCHIVVCGRNVL